VSNKQDTQFVIITGLSGAGKTQAIRSLEDIGFFCVDNLPPMLIEKFAELVWQSEGKINRVALVIDIRGGDFFDKTLDALGHLEEAGYGYTILFLEASDDTLIRRFKETRRRHPLAWHGRISEALREERRRLEELRGRAQRIIDTSNVSPQELREMILDIFSEDQEQPRMLINVVSYGYKHGLPVDADLAFDVRFLPNPHYVESLRPLTGKDEAVVKYIFKWPVTKQFLEKLLGFVTFLVPHYVSEGKTQLTIGVGCTGGRHRSVAIAEYLANELAVHGYSVQVEHRDIHISSGKSSLETR